MRWTHLLLVGLLLGPTLIARVARCTEPGDARSLSEPHDDAPNPSRDRTRGWGLPPEAGTAPYAEDRSWYGNQLIISDVIFLGILLVASTEAMVTCLSLGGPPLDADGCSNADHLGLVAFGGLGFIPAIIHLAHGRVLAAGASLALRVVVPLFINALGFSGVGVFAWLVGAIIDDAVLSYDSIPSAEFEPAGWPLSRNH